MSTENPLDDEGEPESLEWQAYDSYIAALMQGRPADAAQGLSNAIGHQDKAVDLLIELISGELSPGLYPWKFVIKKRYPGRPNFKPKSDADFAVAFASGDTVGGINILRAAVLQGGDKLHDAIKEIINLLRSEGPSPWQFVATHRRKGRPVDLLEQSNRIFPIENLRNIVADERKIEGKKDSAVREVSKKLKRSKSTVYRKIAKASRIKEGI